jgi:hypothetical protein
MMDVVTIHDPCVIRFDNHVYKAVRKLVKEEGFQIEESLIPGLAPFAVVKAQAQAFLLLIWPALGANFARKRLRP